MRLDDTNPKNIMVAPAGCGYKNIAAPLQLTSLVEDTGAAICHHALHHRTLGELSSLVVNLDGQLPEGKH